MSLFCICVVENIKKDSEITLYTQQLETLAKQHKRGIKFFVDWPEPLLSRIQKDSLVMNMNDSPESDNCELFLLPDGWYHNGRTNKLAFRERMKFLEDVSSIFIDRKYSVELYLGLSGTDPEDFFDVSLKNNDLADYLAKTIGVEGIDFDGVHIRIIP